MALTHGKHGYAASPVLELAPGDLSTALEPGHTWCTVGEDAVGWLTGGNARNATLVVVGFDGEVRGMAKVNGTAGPVSGSDVILAGGGANAGTPTVVDPAKVEKRGGLKGHKGMVGGLGTLASGALVTGGLSTSNKGDRTIRIWDPDTLKERHRVKVSGITRELACAKHVYAATWIHEPGDHIVSVGADGEVRWDVAVEQTPSIAITDDDRLLFAHTEATTLYLDESGKNVGPYNGGKPHPRVGKVVYRDPATGEVIDEHETPDEVAGLYLAQAAFSPSGRYVLQMAYKRDETGTDWSPLGTVVWDAEAKRFHGVLEGLTHLASAATRGNVGGWVNGQTFAVFEEAALVAA